MNITPIPWYVSQSGITPDRMCKIFYMCGKPDAQGKPVWGNSVDDGRLLQAAPLLYDTLKTLCEVLPDIKQHPDHFWKGLQLNIQQTLDAVFAGSPYAALEGK